MSGARSPGAWFLFGSLLVGSCLGRESSADDRERAIRVRLLWTPLETILKVDLENGQQWKGTLLDASDSTVLLLCEPDKETRKRLRLGSGVKLKKEFRYEDIVEVEGAASEETVGTYLVLQIEDRSRMEARLRAAAMAGYRVLASAGRRSVVLERVDSNDSFSYVVPDDVRAKDEAELDTWGSEGFRVVPATLGASLGKASAILERRPDDAAPRDYRILEVSGDEEILETAGRGFRLVGLTTPGPTVVLLESVSSGVAALPEYQLVREFDTDDLNRAAREGKRLVACSDGEVLCVFEKTSDEPGEDRYEFLTATRISTLEEELNEAGARGYRLHPRSFGVLDAVLNESFAVMEKPETSARFEYRILSAKRGADLGKMVTRAAQDGFRVVTATAERKTTSRQLVGAVGVGLDTVLTGAGAASRLLTSFADVFVIMERASAQ
jgi:hypothetical protein